MIKVGDTVYFYNTNGELKSGSILRKFGKSVYILTKSIKKRRIYIMDKKYVSKNKSKIKVKYKELEGKYFGFWKIIKIDGSRKYGRPTALCRCQCGNEKLVNIYTLIKGKSKSCGCLAKINYLKNLRRKNEKNR